MKKTQVNYEEIFQLFVSKCDYRTDLHKPFRQNDKYIATDGTSMVFMPCDEIYLKYFEQEKPNTNSVIPKQKTMSVKISITDIEKGLIPQMIDEIIEEEKIIECKDCDGFGEVDFEYEGRNGQTYTHSDNCPICEGEGDITKIILNKTGKMVIDIEKGYYLHGVVFSYRNIEKLIKTAKLLGVNTITKVDGQSKKCNVFELGHNITVLLMPLIINEEKLSEIPVII